MENIVANCIDNFDIFIVLVMVTYFVDFGIIKDKIVHFNSVVALILILEKVVLILKVKEKNLEKRII